MKYLKLETPIFRVGPRPFRAEHIYCTCGAHIPTVTVYYMPKGASVGRPHMTFRLDEYVTVDELIEKSVAKIEASNARREAQEADFRKSLRRTRG